ncbi:lysM and putative peptidoglycan-binding domain-containing protein 3-like [Anneissia japonica]|uniref:lysM and putative peptidoglycan-binding domain-containing protein 3-like n=1 Tax=Anneissia japonica TaxID=1529436 RepID=UPI001425AD45|nr:lysM and putative peptidoglycan-binding domain-containing protein 3-like [Anneissia japonica]
MSVGVLGMKTHSSGFEYERSRLLPASGQVQNVPNARVYIFGDADVSDEEVNVDDDNSIELTQLRTRKKKLKRGKNHVKKESNEHVLLEREIRPSDSLSGFALQYSVPVSELKRINNLIKDQDFYALTKLKIPVKRHGLLTEIKEEEKRRQLQGDDQAGPSNSTGLEEYRTFSDEDDEEEELFSVRKISIRDAICDGEAKQFLRNMDRDLKRIQTATSSKKESLDEVLSMLTEKRIHPFQPNNRQTFCDGATCGLKWWTMVILFFFIGIFIPAFFYYAWSIHESKEHQSNTTHGQST